MTLEQFLEQWNNSDATIEVRTSGSTGAPKVMRVEKQRMRASARATCNFLGLNAGDTALLCMSVDYIAGKMMVVRALEHGLHLLEVEPSGHPLATVNEVVDFAAMVPLQVYNSLQVPQEADHLRHIGNLIIGGGPLDAELERQLATFDNAVWHSYAMTETLSHIALRRVSGAHATPWFTPMHGVALDTSADSCLIIDAPHLCPQPLTTHDVVNLEQMDDGSQRFMVLGRIDNVIITGGVKVHIEQVEMMLKPYLTVPFVVTSVPDNRLGEAVTLLLQGGVATDVEDLCRQVLPRYWMPHHIIVVDVIPMTANGKPARADIARLAVQCIASKS